MYHWKMFAKPETPLSDAEMVAKVSQSTDHYEYLFGLKGVPFVLNTLVKRKLPDESLTESINIFVPLKGKIPRCNFVRFGKGYYTKVVAFSDEGIVVSCLMQDLIPGTEVILAELDNYDIDVADSTLYEIWKNIEYDIICVTKRYRNMLPTKTDDIMAHCLYHFSCAISSIQRGQCAHINLRAFLLSYIRTAPKKAIRQEWLVRPTECVLSNGKRRLEGDVGYLSIDAPIGTDPESGASVTLGQKLEESRATKDLSSSLIYNLLEVVKDPTDRMIIDYLAQGYTLREIADLVKLSHVAVQKRIKGLKDYESYVR